MSFDEQCIAAVKRAEAERLAEVERKETLFNEACCKLLDQVEQKAKKATDTDITKQPEPEGDEEAGGDGAHGRTAAMEAEAAAAAAGKGKQIRQLAIARVQSLTQPGRLAAAKEKQQAVSDISETTNSLPSTPSSALGTPFSDAPPHRDTPIPSQLSAISPFPNGLSPIPTKQEPHNQNAAPSYMKDTKSSIARARSRGDDTVPPSKRHRLSL